MQEGEPVRALIGPQRRLIVPAASTVERACARALVEAERRVVRRYAPRFLEAFVEAERRVVRRYAPRFLEAFRFRGAAA